MEQSFSGLSLLLSLLLFCSTLGRFGPVFGSSAVEDVYRDVLGVLSPGQENLTDESLGSLFKTLADRVQCVAVPCGKVSFIQTASAVS